MGAVAELSEYWGMGRHTTTSSRIFELPGGGEIIDSPGVRALGLWGLEPGEVQAHFGELRARAGRCRFADCTHVHEPDCRVQADLEAGRIARERYESYLRIRASLEPA